MKKFFLFFFYLPLFCVSQHEDQQIKVVYQADYKLPLMKKMLKKTLPKSFTYYYSFSSQRVEFYSSFSMLGYNADIEVVQIDNYKDLKSLVEFNMRGNRGDENMDTTNYKLQDIVIDSTAKITFTGETKKIFNYECIGFTYVGDNYEYVGFLTKDLYALGAIVKGKNYGLPLYLEKYNKKEKITEILTIKSIDKQPFQKSLFSIQINNSDTLINK